METRLTVQSSSTSGHRLRKPCSKRMNTNRREMTALFHLEISPIARMTFLHTWEAAEKLKGPTSPLILLIGCQQPLTRQHAAVSHGGILRVLCSYLTCERNALCLDAVQDERTRAIQITRCLLPTIIFCPYLPSFVFITTSSFFLARSSQFFSITSPPFSSCYLSFLLDPFFSLCFYPISPSYYHTQDQSSSHLRFLTLLLLYIYI